MTDIPFKTAMEVRDYECDMQGIVNNAVYQNYLEWARHCYLRSRGLDFADLTRRGIIVVVIRAELDYLQSLKSGDSFIVTVQARFASKLRLVFDQEILLVPGEVKMLKASITATCINARGRPYMHEELADL